MRRAGGGDGAAFLQMTLKDPCALVANEQPFPRDVKGKREALKAVEFLRQGARDDPANLIDLKIGDLRKRRLRQPFLGDEVMDSLLHAGDRYARGPLRHFPS